MPRAKTPSAKLVGAGGPFKLDDIHGYQAWVARKLEGYPETTEDLVVEVRNPLSLTSAEHKAIVQRCRKANMAIYTCLGGDVSTKKTVQQLGEQFGLWRLDNNLCADNDSITSVRVMPTGRHREYIPYSNRPLNWHTDGYYNRPEQRIRAFLMHCVRDAVSGGENTFLDPEIVYLLMRNQNPDYVAALMQPDAMTIPANIEQTVEIRRAETGPVFSVDPKTGSLHMRYTARKRYIQWKQDSATKMAVRFLEDLLTRGSPYIFRHRLLPDQGIICNNVLHNRQGFEDDSSADRARLLYRARYYDRVAGT